MEAEKETPSKKELRAERKALKRLKKNKRELLEVSTNCINCDSPLALDQRYCPECGGKRIYNRITWRNLLEDFIDRFLNIENSFLKTFVALFKKPEDVIVGYMNGMRKKYLPAFNYFAIALTINGIYNFLLRNWLMDKLFEAQSSLIPMSQDAAQQEASTAWMDTILEYQSLIMFLSIPFLAIMARLVFWNYKKFNLVEHLVIQLYAYSHLSIVLVVLTIAFSWSTVMLQIISFVTYFWMFGYSAYVLKRVFELDFARLILKTALFFAIFLGLSIAGGVVYGGYIAKNLADGTLKDSPFNNLIKEGFEMGKQMKIKEDSLKRLQDSIENKRTLVIDSLAH